MAYTKQTWQDLPSKTTPINASRLGHIEQGIYDAASTADTAASDASSAIGGLANKVDKIEGKELSTNDFTDALKTKLDGIATGAEVNVQSDWSQSDNTKDDYIKNKPTLGTASAKNSTSVVTQSTDLVESGAVYTALQSKADNSVIGTVEDGTTASQAYAVGSHFIRNGAFCTVTTAISSGESLVGSSKFTSGDVASFIGTKDLTGVINKKAVDDTINLAEDMTKFKQLIFTFGSNTSTKGTLYTTTDGEANYKRLIGYDDNDALIFITLQSVNNTTFQITNMTGGTVTYGIRRVVGVR